MVCRAKLAIIVMLRQEPALYRREQAWSRASEREKFAQTARIRFLTRFHRGLYDN
jgi:hypothetical protein